MLIGVTIDEFIDTTLQNRQKAAAMRDITEEEFKSVIHDAVNHPAHYKTGGIETIDFIEAKGLDYLLGNTVKYIARAGKKGDGDSAKELEDLRKGRWYLDRAIARRGGK